MYFLSHGGTGLLLTILLFSVSSRGLTDGDLCNWMNGRKYYIDIGDSGIISAENVTSQHGAPDSSSQPRIPQRCSVELITCPACHIVVSLINVNIPPCSKDNSCRCDYVWIREPAYSKSGQVFCGFRNNDTSLYYESKTKLVSIDFLYSYSYDVAFALQFTAKRNIYELKGGHEFYNSNSTGYFHSPYFPVKYPTDYSAEYIIRNVDSNGFVQLLFTDFQLSPWSFVEIFDSNGSRIDSYNGNTFRPPILMSSGPTLTIKFRANDEYSSSGFKAKYTFVNYPEKYWFNKPSTDCGGFVDDFGGAITMMNMASGATSRSYDCIWLIHPHYLHSYETRISVRVAQFEEMGPKSTLAIHQGLNSEAYLLESVTSYHHHKIPRGQEYVVPISSGFYIRLTGSFNNKSHLAIIYASFKYEECYLAEYFECGNGRCLRKALGCDGFNHCGDGSDEAACFETGQGTVSPDDSSWWRTLTPNYYFPKQDSSSSAGTNTLILVTSLAGLGMFVLTTVMILVKLHRQRQEDAASREFLHTISRDVDSENNSGALQNASGDPPLYDPPPSYEDVIKFYMPPPPNYNSIVRNPHPPSGTGGIDNAAFIPDCNNAEPTEQTNSSCRPHLLHSRRDRVHSDMSALKVILPPGPTSLKDQSNNSSTEVQSLKNSEPIMEFEVADPESIAHNPFSVDLSVNDIPEDFVTESFQTSLPNASFIKSNANASHLSDAVSDYSGLIGHYNRKNNHNEEKNVAVKHKSSDLLLCYCKGACSCPLPNGKNHKMPHSQGRNHQPVQTHSSSDLNIDFRNKNELSTTASENIKQNSSGTDFLVPADEPIHQDKDNPLSTTVTFSTSELKLNDYNNCYKLPNGDDHITSRSNFCLSNFNSSNITPSHVNQRKTSLGLNRSSSAEASSTNSSPDNSIHSNMCATSTPVFSENQKRHSLPSSNISQSTVKVQNHSPNHGTHVGSKTFPLSNKELHSGHVFPLNSKLRASLESLCAEVAEGQLLGNSDSEPLLRRVSSQPGLLLCTSAFPTHKHSKSDGSGATVTSLLLTTPMQVKVVPSQSQVPGNESLT